MRYGSHMCKKHWIFFWCLIILLHSLVEASKPPGKPYRMGYFGMEEKRRIDMDTTRGFLHNQLDRLQQGLRDRETRLQWIRGTIFLWCCKDTFLSVWEDTWELERNPGTLTREVRNPFVRRNIQQRVAKDRTLRKLVGAGYTPRLVWLYGVMLRGVLQCTAMPKIFNPPIGWGAGAALAARFAVREWLPCILLGWYGSEWYWKALFGVKGAPNNPKEFPGVPIAIHQVRF